jgi:hypothetical protein
MVSTTEINNQDAVTWPITTPITLRRLSSSNKDKGWLPGVLDDRKHTYSTTKRPRNPQEKGQIDFLYSSKKSS